MRQAQRLRPAGDRSLLEAIDGAFAFVSREVRYVAIEIGLGSFRPHPPADVLRNRFGDCKDKTFLLRAILDTWGIPSYPVLVRTRNLGPLAEDAPSAAPFNHVVLAVRLPEGVGGDAWSVSAIEGLGRLLFLDATVGEGTAWDLRGDVQGTVALVVHPGGGTLVRLPVQPPEASSVRLTLQARLDEHGVNQAATIERLSSGWEAVVARSRAGRSLDESRGRTEREVQAWLPGAVIRERRIEGLDRPRAPVREILRLEGGRIGKRVGEILVVEPARGALPLLGRGLPDSTRRSSLDIGLPREETIEVRIDLPPGWLPEQIPPPAAVAATDLSASSAWSFEDGSLSYRRTARLLSAEVTPERYEEFREAVRRVRGEDDRPVIVRRGE